MSLIISLPLLLLLTSTTVLAENQRLQDVTYAQPQAPPTPTTPVTRPPTPTTPVTKPPTPTPVTKPPTPTTPVTKPPTPTTPVTKPPTPTAPVTKPPPLAPTPTTKPPSPPVVAPPPTPAPYRQPVKKEECGPLCVARCSLHSRKGLCVRACSTCCLRCKCVPPGTYGNRELCGKCYTDMRTHGNRFKCP